MTEGVRAGPHHGSGRGKEPMGPHHSRKPDSVRGTIPGELCGIPGRGANRGALVVGSCSLVQIVPGTPGLQDRAPRTMC